MVLERLPAAPGPVVAMAFGPGLTLYAALFERSVQAGRA
jgi:alkylresorcinol/alkylpyrone synthase